MNPKSFYYMLLVLVQTIAESFPISSSSHAKLFNKFWQLFFPLPNNWELWEDLVHGSTALALLPMFWVLITNFEQWKYAFFWILIVDTITAIGYFYIRPNVQQWCPAFWLILTGLFLFLLNFLSVGSDSILNLQDFIFKAFCVGVLQCFAFIPGLSRLGLIFVFLRFTGWSTYQAWYWSWLGMMPLLIMRSLLGFYRLSLLGTSFYKIGYLFTLGTISAYVSLYIMLNFVIKSTFLFLYPLILGILWYIFWCV